MKVNKAFVITILILFILVIILNILAIFIQFYSQWMGWVLLVLFIILLVLIFRKSSKVGGTILAYAIPIIIVVYISYYNIIPLQDTYNLDVGRIGDVSKGQELYLLEGQDLGSRAMLDGKFFRTVNGEVDLIFNPKALVHNRTIIAEIEAENVFITSDEIDFNINNYEWDYRWDFSRRHCSG